MKPQNPLSGTEQPDAERFGPAAESSIRSAQVAFRALIDDAGVSGGRAVDIARTLDLDKTLAWKVSRFTDGIDPREAFKHLPGPGGVNIVVRAAQSLGLHIKRIEAVERADRELRSFVKDQAGDRRTFEAMLAGARPDLKAEAEERKAYFRAGSAIWGVRAHAQIGMFAIRPSDVTDKLDCVLLTGFIGLERLRPDLPWVLRRLRTHTDDGEPYVPFKREPLDPEYTPQVTGDLHPHNLMSDFCTQPLPKINQRLGDNGWLYDELAPTQVGRAGAVTITTGEFLQGLFPRYRSDGNTEGRYMQTLRTPVQYAQFDLLLHPELENFRWPTVNLYGHLGERVSANLAPGRALVPEWPAESLTPGITNAPSHIAGYGDLVRSAFDKAEWGDPDAYRGYRALFEHPPAPCEMWTTSELTG